MKKGVISMIRKYQMISRLPVMRALFSSWSGCRSWPTCSDYAAIMIERHGILVGVGMAFRRVLHCNPLIPIQSPTHL